MQDVTDLTELTDLETGAPTRRRDRAPPPPIVVYCLQSLSRRNSTYIGASMDFVHRLRQHNGEIVGGAKYTARFRPWHRAVHAEGFATWRDALRFEWAWKFVTRKLKLTRASRAPRDSRTTRASRASRAEAQSSQRSLPGPAPSPYLARRLAALHILLTDERWKRRWGASRPHRVDVDVESE